MTSQTSSPPASPTTMREPNGVLQSWWNFGAVSEGSTGMESKSGLASCAVESDDDAAAGVVVAAVATAGVSRPKPSEAVRTPQTTAALRNEVDAIGGSF
ncbi:hypothetical protein [Curtobacterium flaccumfaciens]|uniref:hypothetical protein n=1 Tax=Curtobacterium flaccumfaciens TaxID=2035 RepID=UPI000FFEDEF8|nr:hypothetical protein [Curtobacterium flaccumfaciens]MCS0645252.1 hypothetical protein [Curtobacterium flaccumfaciens pv. flaccumfaciens]MCS6527266.1 hypothetical protein [Curtobacterium flaccumfaciens pv. flaccumfaciens]MCS6531046.1 hypothetical protein [Curtobacterium flaccumfaciens pv. flaccumfaciens]NUU09523.1 hypothetical protein [Curtobacterium flaccumfaciens]